MSDEAPDNIEGLFAIPRDPKLDEALENTAPIMRLIADFYAKAVSCGVPPALAEKITFEYFRTQTPTLFNGPTIVYTIMQLPGFGASSE